MSKIATALGLSLGLICWAQSSMADPDDSGAGQTPSSALPLPQVNGTGPAQGWRRHRMQADAAAGSTTSGTTAGANAGGGTGSGPGQGQGGGRRQFQGLTAGKGGGGRGQGHGVGGKFKAVMALPSLTADQRQKIKPIIDGWKQDLQAFRSQQGAGGGQTAGATAGAPAKGAPAVAGAGNGDRKQMRQKTMAAWQKVKALLTESQINELDQTGNNGQLVAPKGTQASAAKADGAADSE